MTIRIELGTQTENTTYPLRYIRVKQNGFLIGHCQVLENTIEDKEILKRAVEASRNTRHIITEACFFFPKH
jgi:hypothetical protein